ncbi:MGMT family protein [Paenibacillus sp. GCM10023248]|uniref:MGMT family protein n=1 Tax=Bacillales TaxID=1385 RepID=UPI002377E707|nr:MULTISPECIES: MGMT family protein [Bacillales]MDD9268840.1 MGMT family protein [Paenibacillus sp. MAHUQ-63]MDR6882081.1 methylated-DNA-protein-cysteine methyltransferase-like protein [Bacillus sp. 3255]
MTPFTERVIGIIRSIPEGKVMTYGQIARLAGSPRGARQVVRILHAMGSKYKLPWHRVVNAKGEIAIADDEGAELQSFLLQAEGVRVSADRLVSLEQYQAAMEENA